MAEDDWQRIARKILKWDFAAHPVDRSTIQAWRIGLRGYGGDCALAIEKLTKVKPVKWGKRDIEAGFLVPRKPGEKEDE